MQPSIDCSAAFALLFEVLALELEVLTSGEVLVCGVVGFALGLVCAEELLVEGVAARLLLLVFVS